MQVKQVAPEDRPWETEWVFKFDEGLFRKFVEFIKSMAQDLYERWVGFGGVVPAQAEITDDYGWAFCGDFGELPIQYDCKNREITIVIMNEPDCEFDKLDPEHEEWSNPSKLQWLRVASLVKAVMDCESVEGLAIYNPFETAGYRRAHAAVTI